MAKYIVSYDLKKPGDEYEKLIKHIQTFDHWARIHKSVWFVETEKSAKELRDDLLSYIDSNDKIFVVKESGEAAWRGVIASTDYLMEHL
jgi:CRISPR/Cas system-associated endoribonuclease Cas2